ncbi:MAG TPA: type IV conjugative transfer system protein TraL [Desulfobacterales bacterium]|nr:type IV conjugative transfer system protein TraL [Desulfobacterales bacterium]
MVFMVAGNMLGQFFLGLGAGWAVSHLYRCYKNTRPDGYLLHFFYWLGLAGCTGLTFVNPYKRSFEP